LILFRGTKLTLILLRASSLATLRQGCTSNLFD
jgi:hypothetical protein